MDNRRNNYRDNAVRAEADTVTNRLRSFIWSLTDFVLNLLFAELAIVWTYILLPRFTAIRLPNEFLLYCAVVGPTLVALLLLLATMVYIEKSE